VNESQVQDTLNHLMPLARRMARRYEIKFGKNPGELETVAMLGAWEAARSYDGRVGGPSIWGYASTKIVREFANDDRIIRGRSDSSKQSRAPIPCDFEDWEFDPYIEEGFEQFETNRAVREVLSALSPMQQTILRKTFFEGVTLAEFGAELGVTESRACQLRGVALQSARKLLSA